VLELRPAVQAELETAALQTPLQAELLARQGEEAERPTQGALAVLAAQEDLEQAGAGEERPQTDPRLEQEALEAQDTQSLPHSLLNMPRKSTSLSVGRGEKLPASRGAGLTAKGRAKYNRETGSNLKAPAPNPKTKADAGRKKSFCARMAGVVAKAKGPAERAKASLKRWKC
jgi:hypothetical protein